MSTLPEQFSAARKAQVETQLDVVRNFTNKVVESTEKLVALNLSTSRSSLEQSTAGLRALLHAKDPRDLISLTSQSQSGFERLLAYSGELLSIATRAQTELLNSVTPVTAFTRVAAFTPRVTVPVPALAAPVVEVEAEVEVEAAPAVSEYVEHVEAATEAATETFTEVASELVTEAAAEVEVPAPLEVEAPVLEAAPVEVAEPIADSQPAAPVVELASEEVPVPDSAHFTPVAQAINELVADSEGPVLAASQFATEAAHEVKITGIEPVDAQRPPQVETQAPKTRKKK